MAMPPENQRMLSKDFSVASSEDAHGLDTDVQANLLCPSALSCALSSIPCCWPFWICNSLKILNTNEQAAVMCWGQYAGSITDPGIVVLNPVGVELLKVFTGWQTLQLNDTKCTDGKGSPILVSGNIVYRIYSAKKAMVDVQGPQDYLRQQAPMVMRKVCAMFPYEDHSGKASLRGPGTDNVVGKTLRNELHAAVTTAGIEVVKFDLTDLSYAPEIAAAMLQKQQAEAMIDARAVVVESAVDIASSAVKRMRQLGHQMTPQGEERLVTNLLTVICGDRGASPTIQC